MITSEKTKTEDMKKIMQLIRKITLAHCPNHKTCDSCLMEADEWIKEL